MVEIRINYETLFDLLRKEKNREELQILDPDFYEQVEAYLREKEAIVNGKEDRSYFSNDHEKLKIQFLNIRRLIKELYERREKKILNLAMIKARTGSDILDLANLLPNEKTFFQEETELLSRFKEDVLDRIINPREQKTRKQKPVVEEEASADYEPEVHFARQETGTQINLDGKPALKKIKIIEYLPKFVGRQGEILGPYEKDSVVELEPQIAELLLKKGRAESMEG